MPEHRAAPSPRHARPSSRRAAMTTALTALAGSAAAAVAPVSSPDTPSPTAGAPTQSARSAGPSTTTAGAAWTPKKQAINRQDRAAPHPLLSHAIRSGPLLFLAGIGGWYPEDRAEPGDAKVQIDSALKAMKMLLEQAGSSIANVLKVHMTVADPNRNLAAINEGYKGQFPDPPPARSYSGCGVDQMGRDGVLVQIDCVAYVD
jgi:enamine deaminase RidA (YjgF/YER057c/UK114 family)